MSKIFDVLKAHQISLGEFGRDIDKVSQGVVIKTAPKLSQSVIKGFVEALEIKTVGIENLNEIEKQIYAIGIYIMKSLGRFIFDSTGAQRIMNSNRRDAIGA